MPPLSDATHRLATSTPGSSGLPPRSPVLTRRRLLAGSLAAAVGVPWLNACSGSGKDTEADARNAAALLPTYKAVNLVDPDLPGDQLVMPGYYRYPQDPAPVFTTPPGAGLGEISLMYITFVAVPGGPDKNAFYRQLEDKVGAKLKISFVPAPDYATKFATTVAGGDLPEVINFPLPTADQPRMMEKLFADLGPYLGGDAASDFPYLASFPTDSWRPAVSNGSLYAVPQPRALTGTAMYARLDLIEAVGANPAPSSYAELIELMTAVTDSKARRWAFANPTNMVLHLMMMLGAPNGWSDSGGTFTNAYADERYKQAVGLVTEMVAKGLFHPDSASVSYTRIRELFFAGQLALTSDGYAGWDLFTRQLGGPDVGATKLGLVVEPKFDGGGDAAHFAGTGIQGITVIKKGLGDERTRSILNVLNFLAAPIGSREHLDRKFGVEGTDFTWEDGLPTLTDVGQREFLDVQYLTDAQTILGPGSKDGVDRQHAWHQRVSRGLVKNPSVGLYSDTNSTKGTTLGKLMADAQSDVIFGRKPLRAIDDAYKTWRSSGGDAMAAEFAESKAAVG